MIHRINAQTASLPPARPAVARGRPMVAPRAGVALMVLLMLVLTSVSPARAIVTYHLNDPNPGAVAINLVVGADRFYNAGFFGFNTVIANVEAGHTWNQHETLHGVTTFLNDPSINFTPRQYDYHATMVGFVLAGLGPPTPNGGYYYYQFGMAPGATLVSTAIATDWVGHNGQFEISTQSLDYGYVTTMQTGFQRQLAPGITITQKADVINSSWGFEDPAGTDQATMTIDALAYANHQTVVLAAGNHDDPGSAQVGGPASGYNSITVAALTSDVSTPVYGSVASFSNAGPNDFVNPADPTHPIAAVRPTVDIAAPGTNMFLAAYTGTTGTNPFGVDPAPGATNLYFIDAAGTSFASPVVAGGAALVVDAGYWVYGGGQAVDGRVVKAVLLNSAHKTDGWTNQTSAMQAALITHQGLDFNVGAGELDLNRAYDQYLAGTANVPGLVGGQVQSTGWDFGHLFPGTFNNYLITRRLLAGETFTATLDWFVDRAFNPATSVASDVAFDDLDLEVWLVVNGVFDRRIALSATPCNNVEQIYLTLAEDGYYGLRVDWGGVFYDLAPGTRAGDDYGLAWSSFFDSAASAPRAIPIPEMNTSVLAVMGLIAAGMIGLPRRPERRPRENPAASTRR